MTQYQTLEVWKQSMALVKEVYLLTKGFPQQEQFGLTNQIRRAAVSVPANIAEGSGRQYKKDTIQFLHIARGSLYELETLLQIASMTDHLSIESYHSLVEAVTNCSKLLNGYIQYHVKSSLK